MTTPPCTEKVYWNVATKVYPINGKHLSAFTYLLGKEMRKPGGKDKITMGGNYRVIQSIKKQNPVILENKASSVTEDDDSYVQTNNVLKILLIFVAVNILIELGLNYAILKRKEERAAEREQEAIQRQMERRYADQESVEVGIKGKK